MTKTSIEYHVFTHERDEWYTDIDKAQTQFDKWATEFGSARLYEERFTGKDEHEEDCLQAVGDFPW